MELLPLVIFVTMIISFLMYARGLQENKDIRDNEISTRHKLMNQNTTIIFLLFTILAVICFALYAMLFV